jgi:hypothetical protein
LRAGRLRKLVKHATAISSRRVDDWKKILHPVVLTAFVMPMNVNVRNSSVIRHHPGFIRDHDWTINGPAIGPEQTPHRWPTDRRAPMDRHRDIEWPPQDRRTPRVPVPEREPEEDEFPYISPTQPATCWLI